MKRAALPTCVDSAVAQSEPILARRDSRLDRAADMGAPRVERAGDVVVLLPQRLDVGVFEGTHRLMALRAFAPHRPMSLTIGTIRMKSP